MAPSRGPCTLEWRSMRSRAEPKPQNRVPRAALCMLGVPRFFDDTAQLLRRNLLERIGRPTDLFAFVTASRRPAAPDCPQPHRLVETLPGDGHLGDELRRVAPSGQGDFEPGRFAGDGASLLTPLEWASLEVFLQKAVAGQVAWGDRPVELLSQHPAAAWRRVAARPGPWLGGLAKRSDVGHDDITGSSPTLKEEDSMKTNISGIRFTDGSSGHHVRPSAGLSQLRTMQWCADAVRWHEENILNTSYSHVLFARWDLQWLIPFPGLELLQDINSEEIWLQQVQGEFFANDRFAVVPRPRLSAYFEGWKLVVSGEAADAFQKHMPRVGNPFFLQDFLVFEGFLHLRLAYAGLSTMPLPPLFYVYCRPSSDPRTFRSLGFFDCTPLAALADVTVLRQARDDSDAAFEALEEALGGAKYGNEITWVLATDSALQTFGQAERVAQEGSEQLLRLLQPRLDHIRGRPEELAVPINWTKDHLFSAVFMSSQIEAELQCQYGPAGEDVPNAA
ncbi:hmgA [Symbiodinium natans]|uniref:HmgA protein n=1 Tax=Symbiodinium natans TaxID=878477 RepID=A0A812K5P6_9DINO|nr:hmgA [Symbiodinium natans]